MGIGAHVNRPCPCGSGKKLKKCCIDKVKILSPEETKRVVQQARPQSCVAPVEALGPCKQHAIDSHLIQRARLARFAQNGEVLQISTDFTAAHAGTPTVIAARPINVSRATVFSGFCAEHDSEIFKPIEQESLVPTKHQAGLLAYRSIAARYHSALHLDGIIPFIEDQLEPKFGEVKFTAESLPKLGYAMTRIRHFRESIQDWTRYKKRWDQILLQRDESDFEALVVRFEEELGVATSVVFAPECDAQGTRLLDMTQRLPALPMMHLSIIPDPAGTVAVLVWHRQDIASERFVSSLEAADRDVLGSVLIRIAYEYSSPVMGVQWWVSLPSEVGQDLISRRHKLPEERSSKCLVDDPLLPKSRVQPCRRL